MWWYYNSILYNPSKQSNKNNKDKKRNKEEA